MSSEHSHRPLASCHSTDKGTPTLAAYDRLQALAMVRCWTPQQLFDALQAQQFGTTLHDDEARALATLLQDWMQRALGLVTLRDAIWVDPQRGARVYHLICAAHTVATCAVPPALDKALHALDSAELSPAQVRALPQNTAPQPALEALLQHAERDNLTLVRSPQSQGCSPLPNHLDYLAPLPPPPYQPAKPRFEQPVGWRRTLALLLVIAGVVALGGPLLMGHIPAQPAGLPLGLLTLGLLVGIRAGWPGISGATCLWLVANLPDFHHDQRFSPWSLLLVLVGVLLLSFDGRVRALWCWIWQRKPTT